MIKIILDKLTNRKEIFSVTEQKVDVSKVVKDIIENVKTNGDKALKEYTLKFDKAEIKDLKVTREEILDA
ncbi:MAG: histidinol dehydrogenase, partial [Clostridia bacterium]|nr:histidinol dehydrogenase [Clostridia bacterium]